MAFATLEDIKNINPKDEIKFIEDTYLHKYRLALYDETAEYFTKRLFPDDYESRFINEIFIYIKYPPEEFDPSQIYVRVEDKSIRESFYYMPVLDRIDREWIKQLVLPTIMKATKGSEIK